MVNNNINKTYTKYKKSVNMDYSDMKKWSKNPCSSKASIGRTAVNRNLKLLKKPKSKWDNNDVREANKTISFNARMQKVKPGKIVEGCNMSKRDISLANWGRKTKNFSSYPYTYYKINNNEGNRK